MSFDLTALSVDADRLAGQLDRLATWNEAEPPVVTRVVFTEQDSQARRYVVDLCTQAGLTIRVDAVGNTFARWEGLNPALPAVATGSHIDAIPGAGRFDGTVGVLGAIEAVQALRRVGYQPVRSIEVILFTSEEPTRFGVGCLGSRMMAGVLSAERRDLLRDGAGQSLDEVRSAAGFSGSLDSVRLAEGHYAAFVELHIEQGPLLERAGLPIGIVEAIAAPATVRITLTGEGGHAGTVLMPERRDALCAAAEVILAVEQAARSSRSLDSVATVGVCRVTPGAVNGIPSCVVLEVDIRDIAPTPRDQVVDQVRSTAVRVAAARGLEVQVEILNIDPPATCGPSVVRAIAMTCQALQISSLAMVSRAYHDALFMARIAPTGMIFIPSLGGYSHRPEEYSSPAEIARGVQVLAGTLATLASEAD